MKKSLLALAAMGAFAGAAQAQSSVTVYGILDVGFAGTTSRVPQVDSTAAYKTNATSFNGGGNETTSRLGFRGTEDLGGGTRAFFTVEMQMNIANANNFTNMTNRQSFVGLAQKGIGQFAIGTQYTPIHLNMSTTDPGQQNNVVGNVIYAVNTTTTNAAYPTSYTVRQNNSLSIQTERFAGFRVLGLYSNNNSDRTQSGVDNSCGNITTNTTSCGGNVNNTFWGLGADYQWQKLLATFNYQVVKNESNSAAQTVNAISSTVSTTQNEIGVNTSSTQMYGGVTYDFGVLKAYAQWISNKIEGGLNSNIYAKRTAQQLGVRGFITPKIEGWASAGNGRVQAFGVGEPTANFTGYQLGANYWLSKRTNLYGIFGSTQTSTIRTNNSTTANDINGAAGNSMYAVGVRHTF